MITQALGLKGNVRMKSQPFTARVGKETQGASRLVERNLEQDLQRGSTGDKEGQCNPVL